MGRPKSLVGKSELARELGLSRGRVSQLLREGMPARPDGLVNREECVAWYRENVVARCRELDEGDRPATAKNVRSSAAQGSSRVDDPPREAVEAAVRETKPAAEVDAEAPKLAPVPAADATPLTMPSE